jgi:Outer membrane protein beta-barrel domain
MKHPLLVTFIFMSMIASAQIEKGSSFVSGQLSHRINSSDAFKSTDFTVGGEYGYILSSRWALGINTSYKFSRQQLPNNLTQYQNNLNAGIFARRYFALTDKLYLNLDGMAAIGNRKSRSESNFGTPLTSTFNELRLSVTPGATYFVTRKIALNLNLGQLMFTKSLSTPPEQRTFTLEAGISRLSVGMSIYLR